MNTGGHKLMSLVYVDDILIGYDSEQLMTNFKLWLANIFKLNNLGVPRYFLGLKLAR